MTTKEVFTKTANALEEFGWIQGRFGSTKSGFCLLGALAFSSIDEYHEAFHVLAHKLETSDIIRWNDNPARTKTQVINLLRELSKEDYDFIDD